MIESIVGRWDATIADVLGRVDVLLARASAESEASLPSADLPALSRVWLRSDAQLGPLKDELSNAWSAYLDEFAAQAPAEELLRAQGAKRDYATCEVGIRRERAYRAVMAKASQRLKALADEQQSSALRGSFDANGARHLAELAAFVDWERMTRAHTYINGYRDRKDVPLALLQELQSSAQAYFTQLFTLEAEQVPLQRPYVAAKIERHMKDIDRTLRQHWQWRARG